MVVVTKALRLSTAVMFSVGTLWPCISQADQLGIGYTITTPDTPTIGFVTTNSVSIKVTGPSSEAIRHTKLTLNGLNVTNWLSQDGVGVESRLEVGSNTFKLFESKNSNEPVARPVIERATKPDVTSGSLSPLVNFPIKPTRSERVTTITLAQLK